MPDKKKIIIVAHFCDYATENTNNRFNYLASMLGKKGYEVELITSSFSHRDKKQRIEIKDNQKTYQLTLIHEPSYRKNVSLKRLLISHKIFAKNVYHYLKQSRRPDLLYCAFPSIDVAKVASEYAVNNNIPFIIDIQDLWPEAFQMTFNIPIFSNIIFSPLTKTANKIYGSADEIIAVSKTYVDRAMIAAKKGANGHVVYLGTDLDKFDSFNQKDSSFILDKRNDEKWIAYCGTLGKSYDLISVIDALDLLKENAPKFIVMGDGPRKEEFEQYASKKQISCLFTGRLPYIQMCSVLKKCDMVVNPIVGDSVASIINKHADYAASGLPVINTQNSEEYRQLVRDYQMGVNCVNGDSKDIASKIENLLSNELQCIVMGRNARKCSEEKFNRKYTYQQIVRVIEKYL